jgi:hypothetical protein
VGLWAAAVSLSGHAGLLMLAGAVAQFANSGEGSLSPEVWTVTLNSGTKPGPGPSGPPGPAGMEEQDLLPEMPDPTQGGAATLPESTPTSAAMTVGPEAQGGGVSKEPAHGQGPGHGTSSGPPMFFQLPLKGQSVVFVIDRSTSMDLSGGLPAAKREVLASLGQLPESAQFQIILYNRHPICLGGRKSLLMANADNLTLCRESLDTIQAQGSTNHIDALQLALFLEPDILVLLTDADDLTLAEVRSLSLLNRRGTTIHTLAWGPKHSEGSPLQRLAEMNGGSHKILLP